MVPQSDRRAPVAAHAGQRSAAPPRQRRARRLDLGALVGLAIIIGVTLAALLAPALAPHDPARQHLDDAFQPPTPTYPLGTDHLGRDIASRLLHGARATLGASAAVLLSTLLIATIVGAVAGFAGGWADALLMRLVDLLLAFPGLILAIAVAGTLGAGLAHVALAMAAVWWAGYARLIRGMVRAAQQQGYVQAAHALGLTRRRILIRHVLPSVAGPIAVLATLDIGAIILSIAGLSLLGLGAQPPTPEWGAMLNDAQPFLQTDPRQILWPSASIAVTALGFNLLGDGIRDWLDPHQRQR